MSNSNLRTGDTVVVIAGKDKGKKGKIIASFPETNRVTVAGVNIVHKHRKARSQKEQAEIKKVEASVDVSNVQIICPACGKATRIAHKIDEQGNKHRSCKKCGAIIESEKKAKATKSKKDEVVKEAKEEKAAKAPKKEASAEKTTKKGASAAKKTVETATKKKASETKSQSK